MSYTCLQSTHHFSMRHCHYLRCLRIALDAFSRSLLSGLPSHQSLGRWHRVRLYAEWLQLQSLLGLPSPVGSVEFGKGLSNRMPLLRNSPPDYARQTIPFTNCAHLWHPISSAPHWCHCCESSFLQKTLFFKDSPWILSRQQSLSKSPEWEISRSIFSVPHWLINAVDNTFAFRLFYV